ncbi:MAG TPA: SIS domain-containing protein [Bacillota bacterium]|jgi:glucosamine--fructose-6-phosphate aminotransferase (isomerizing)|nr:SIS domain-containing protein [Bacillota bacterium]HOO31079.1 SIS domain-containing protein [Bacillota bacterium]HPQ03562.1 SIS domain-containing protein [Bacillota bacterium]
MDYILKEILEESEAARTTIEKGDASQRQAAHAVLAADPDAIYAVGCGSSYFAGMMARYPIEGFVHIPTIALSATDFITYSLDTITDASVVIGISQSGESFETVEAIEKAKDRGALLVGLTNNPTSSIGHIADELILTYAGEEKASGTKTVLAQMLAAYQFALAMAELKSDIVSEAHRVLANELDKMPDTIGKLLERRDDAIRLAKELKDDSNLYLVGAGPFYPLGLQIANTAREIARVHVNAFDVVEFRHGPLEIVESGTPVVFISNSYSPLRDNIATLASLVKRAGGRVIAATDESDVELNRAADIQVTMPSMSEIAGAIAYLSFFHMFLYNLAVEKGLNPNEFRNIVKTWTQEPGEQEH